MTGEDDLTRGWEVYTAARDIAGPAAFTTAWHDLPVGDVRRRAALVRGAWYWHCAENDLACPAGRRGVEELVEREVARELRAASHAVAASADWSTASRDLMFDSAARRRRAEALRPRPSDYRGGPVDWTTGAPISPAVDTAA